MDRRPRFVHRRKNCPQLPLAREAYHILHSFGKSTEDGSNPSADLINVKGTLYGTTTYGGAHNSGSVFSITRSGEERVLYSFGPGDGCCPVAPLLNVKGTLYGTAAGGGTYGGGAVFKLTLDGKETILHNFDSDYYSYDTNSGLQPPIAAPLQLASASQHGKPRLAA